ncbi:hypothetical protein [Rummeliibacillus suwonensis]|uniref:hypothetical protein n=1 Tax=Rummeliibacillus suwonensis TaxID=1306154 RepID=UPI0028A1C2DE|nr:hypothetical protein [Rummeliibacillus suwonensis]
MRILNSLYPYPVLSIDDDDYVGSSKFVVSYSLSEATSFKKAKLTANFVLEDNSLEQLISNGFAAMFLHIESPRAAYRKLYTVENNQIEVEIDHQKMRTVVEVTAFILVTKTLENYHNPTVNKELYGSAYVFPKLESGDPLAVSFTQEIELEEMNDFAQVSSIIKVAQTQDKLMKVDYDQDIIFVYLPKEQYEKYLNYPQIFGEVMLSSIIMPSLIYVLDAVSKNAGEGMQDKKWYKVIEKKMELLDYSMNSLFNGDVNTIVLAQEILKNPLERMFMELKGVIDRDA